MSPPIAGKPGSMLRRLALNTSAYTIGNLLVMIGSLVSFPILTRLLTVDEYGLMGLVSATLLFLIALAKVGVQASAVRFYSKVVTQGGTESSTPRQLYSTLLFGMSATGLLVTLLWFALGPLTPEHWWNDARVHGLFMLTAWLVLVRVLDSALINIFRAQQRAGAHAAYNAIKRWVGVAMTIGSILLVSRSVYGFYYGALASESLAVIVLALIVNRFARFAPSEFSWSLFQRMLVFGLPLVGSEMATALLNLGDRYLLQLMLGAQEVGKYTAAYNMCEYAETVAITSVGSAIGPIYLRIFDQEGREATEAFLSRSLRYYFLIGVPLIAGMSAVGPEALTILASEKYREGVVVIPWVISGTFVSGLQSIAVAGLYIDGKTWIIMVLVLFAATVNVVLNLILIPHLGIEGAGIATLVSFLVVTISMERMSRRTIHVRVPWRSILRFAVAAVVMYFAVNAVNLRPPIVGLIVKVVLGAATYAALLAAIDGESREMVLRVVRRLSGGRRAR